MVRIGPRKRPVGQPSKGINDFNDDRCARNTDEIKYGLVLVAVLLSLALAC